MSGRPYHLVTETHGDVPIAAGMILLFSVRSSIPLPKQPMYAMVEQYPELYQSIGEAWGKTINVKLNNGREFTMFAMPWVRGV